MKFEPVKPKPKRYRKRSREYSALITNKRWTRLRNAFIAENPLCIRCLSEGLPKAAEVVHHHVPIETARSPRDMEALAYDPKNLRSLCTKCHAAVHREMQINSSRRRREYSKAQTARFAERFLGGAEEKP